MSKVISAQLPDELVEKIEAIQADDEPRSAAVRRVVRAGVDDLSPPSVFDRLTDALAVVLLFLPPVVGAWEQEVVYTVGYVGITVLLVLFGPEFDAAVSRLKTRFL